MLNAMYAYTDNNKIHVVAKLGKDESLPFA